MSMTSFVPRVENKYSLTFEDLKNLKVGNRNVLERLFGSDEDLKTVKCSNPDLLEKLYSSYNEYVSAWVIRDATSDQFCECEYYIHIYDDNSPKNAGEVEIKFVCYMGMCGFGFTNFYVPEEVKNDESRLEIQEKFMKIINMLLDEGALVKG